MKLKLFTFIFSIVFLSNAVIAHGGSSQKSSVNTTPPVKVVFNTSEGNFTVQLFPDKAPNTVANFLSYVDSGFYNNTLFHRVIPKFIVQGGGFTRGMKQKNTFPAIKNESINGLKNTRGMVAMSHSTNPDSAMSEFFINLRRNMQLDPKDGQPGYTVFGKVISGMDVIDSISKAATKNVGRYKSVPATDILIISAKRKQQDNPGNSVSTKTEKSFISGQHYIELDKPYPVTDKNKIEVVEAFSYACAHCFSIEPTLEEWRNKQPDDVQFLHFPAVWNTPMKLYARTYFTAQRLQVAQKIHLILFTAIVIDQIKLSNESELADFFAEFGVDKKQFSEVFNSPEVDEQVKHAEERTSHYRLGSVPEIVVNGKYRVNPMRAGGQNEMFDVVDYLINKERQLMNSK